MNMIVAPLIILCIIFLVCYLYEKSVRTKLEKQLTAQNVALAESDLFTDAILKNVHAYILLIDNDFVVLRTNYYMLTNTIASLDKKRVGDLLQCHNAMCAAGGCGTGDFCKVCPIRHAIQHALDTKTGFTNLEASLNVQVDETHTATIDASISGSYFVYGDQPRMVLTVHDITALKKK
jgi:hypothetical protein